MCFCDNIPDYYKSTKRKARKTHVCDECSQPIKKGTHYFVDRGVIDGEWYGSKRCLECDDLYHFLLDRLDCFCPNLGELMEEIRDSDIQNEDYLIPLFLNEQGILQEMDTSVEESSKEYDEYRHDAFFASHFRLKEAFVKEAA